VARPQAVPGLDVQQEFSAALHSLGPGLAYSRLLRFRSPPEVQLPSLEVECDLCESWEQPAPDTYIFHLRRGVRWQNIEPVNGRELTAQDVAFSLQRQRTSGYPNAGLLRAVKDIQVLGRYDLKITLTAPDADFLINLADARSKIVAPEVVSKFGGLAQAPVIGTGPWMVESTDPRKTVLKPNPDYFIKGLPYLDKLVFETIQDPQTRLTAFKVRRVGVANIPIGELAALKQAHPDLQVFSYPDAGTGVELSMNTKAPPFDDPRVRKAVFLALDPWTAIDNVWQGQGFVSLGAPVARADWLLSREELEPYFNQPSKAQQLVRQVSGGQPIAFTLTVGNFGELYVQYAQNLANQLRAVGFDPKIKVVDLADFQERVWFGGDYAMFLGVHPPMTTPNTYLLSVLHSNGSANTHGYSMEELDELIERQSVEMDPDRRAEMFQEITRKVLDAAVRFMPVTFVRPWAYWPDIGGFQPNLANGEYAFWAKVWRQK